MPCGFPADPWPQPLKSRRSVGRYVGSAEFSDAGPNHGAEVSMMRVVLVLERLQHVCTGAPGASAVLSVKKVARAEHCGEKL